MEAHQRWTQSDITELRTRLQTGEGVAAIAAAVQRDADEVLAMMGRLRLRAVQPA